MGPYIVSSTPFRLVYALREINKFIQGGQYQELEAFIDGFSQDMPWFEYNFYRATINKSISNSLAEQGSESDNEEKLVIIELENLFNHLGVSPDHWSWYLDHNLTIYDLLSYLNADRELQGNTQISVVLRLLDSKYSRAQKFITIVLGASLASLIVLNFTPLMRGIIELKTAIMASALVTPIFGFCYTLGVAGYSLYGNLVDKKKSLTTRLRENFFVLLNSLLNLTGYALWLASTVSSSGAATAAMPPVAGLLFISAAALDVLKEIGYAIVSYKRYIELANNQYDLNSTQEYARLEIEYRKHTRAALINTVAALALFATIAVWCLVPGGLFVAIPCLAAIAVINASKSYALNCNDALMRDSLQMKLRTIKASNEQIRSSYDMDNLTVNLREKERVDVNYQTKSKEIELPPTSFGRKYGFFIESGSMTRGLIVNKNEVEFEIESTAPSVTWSTGGL